MIIPFPTVSSSQIDLGRRVRAIRVARGFSLERLALEAHLTPRDMRLAEEGRLRLDTEQLHALTSALHVPLGLVFAGSADLSQLRRL